jgi:hypothetical protein
MRGISAFHMNNYVSGLTVPVVISDGNTIGWYKSDEPSTITKDGSNKVSAWNDFLGSGRNLTNTTTVDFGPTWSAAGIEFDGLYNYLNATFTLVQPVFMYAVMKVFTGNGDYAALWNGVGGPSKCSAYPLTGNLVIDAEGGLTGPALTLDAFIIVRALYNGAGGSKVLVNATSQTGSVGAAGMGGLVLGSSVGVGYGGSHSHVQYKEVVLRKISDSGTDETAIYNYLKAKYGL